ncbi:MAG TPA: hypothetical protein VHM91_25655 [Verrucomicrobiales bacterium]|nr:hypothetical protein [Verrucomicrobiales bacterium]
MNRLLSLALLVAPLISSATAQDKREAAEKRTITFHRVETKGSKYDVSAKVSVVRTTDAVVDFERRPAGKAVNLQVSLDGQMEILAVTPKAGRPLEVKFIVRKFTVSTDGAGKEEARQVKEIVAKAGKSRPSMLVDGKEPDAATDEILRTVLPTLAEVDEKVEDTFSSPGPVAPGERWTPDIREVAKVFSSVYQMGVDPAKSSVTMLYKGPATAAGMDGDSVVASVTSVFNRIQGLPDGAKLKTASSLSRNSTVIARDTKIASPLSGRYSTYFDMVFSTEDEGKPVDVIVKSHSELQVTMKPQK